MELLKYIGGSIFLVREISVSCLRHDRFVGRKLWRSLRHMELLKYIGGSIFLVREISVSCLRHNRFVEQYPRSRNDFLACPKPRNGPRCSRYWLLAQFFTRDSAALPQTAPCPQMYRNDCFISLGYNGVSVWYSTVEVESHIIWDVPALVTASCSGTTCGLCVHWETATFNSSVT